MHALTTGPCSAGSGSFFSDISNTWEHVSCCQSRFVNGCEWGALCRQPKITHGTYTARPLSLGPLLLAEIQTCKKGIGKGLRVEGRSEEEVEEWILLAVCWCTLYPSEYWRHSSHGRQEAVGIGMCLLAVFWDEILCFWCM